MSLKKIAIGSDHGGFLLKEKLIPYLKSKKISLLDVGTFSKRSVDYPDTAYKLARLVSTSEAWGGILICKSGIGNSIVANKLKKCPRSALL